VGKNPANGNYGINAYEFRWGLIEPSITTHRDVYTKI
jgi:hypothetical protein